MTRFNKALLVTFISATTVIANAQQDPEKAELRRQLEELKKAQQDMQKNFDKKIADLERKLEAKDRTKAEALPVKIEGLLQTRADFDSGASDSFYIRRSELKFSGKVSPRVGWTVMIDPAKELRLNTAGTAVNQNSRILQDAFATVELGGPWSVDIGQRKIPVSFEALMPTYSVDTLERALFISQGRLADQRDIGVQLYGKWPDFEMTAAALNGTGESQNTKDPNDQKTFGGRIVYKPRALQGLHLGASSLSGTGPTGTKTERQGLEAQWKREKLTLRSEVVTGLDANVRSRGAYGLIGYQMSPQWQALAKLDAYDPNLQAMADETTDTILGVNYFLSGHNAKFQFNWVSRRLGNGSKRSMWQFGLQTRW